MNGGILTHLHYDLYCNLLHVLLTNLPFVTCLTLSNSDLYSKCIKSHDRAYLTNDSPAYMSKLSKVCTDNENRC